MKWKLQGLLYGDTQGIYRSQIAYSTFRYEIL